MSSRRATAVLGAVVALAGCNARVRIEKQVWNLFSIHAALAQGAPVAAGPTLPGGVPGGDLLTQNADGSVTLKVQRAFAAGQPAAFVTTELWVDYDDAIWLQPLYAQVITDAPLTQVAQAPRVIDVGPDSAFYSPFWLVSYAVVGDVAPHQYRSSKALLDNASAIVPAGVHTCPLRPLEIVGRGLALPPPWDAWNAAIPLSGVPEGEAVFTDEGEVETVGLFDFGTDLVRLDVRARSAVVAGSPMFLFVDASGAPLAGEPRVLGAGPVGVDAGSGLPRPRYGGLWRVYEARLPGSAGAFHGDAHADARDAAMRGGGDPLDYEGRVAIDASCFDGAAANGFPDGCVWLDSQDQLESLLGAGNLVATEIMQTGPIVLWNKQPVPVAP
jgi:hypothetical protein